MRIAIVHPSLNFCGGAEKVCLAFARALLEAGHEVTLVTIDKTDWHMLRGVFGDAFIMQFKEHFLFVRMPRMVNTTMRGFFMVLFYLINVFLVRLRGDFDLLVSTSGEFIDSFADLVYINALPLRLMHLYPNVYVERGTQWRCYSKLHDIFLKIIAGTSDRSFLLTNSSFNREIIKRNLCRESLVLYPPVDVGKFKASAKNFEREGLVVTVSRFRPGKVLGVVPKIAELVRDSRFLIIGPSSEASEGTLKELKEAMKRLNVEDRFELLIGEPQSKLLQTLGKAKVLLHTQPYEAFGIAVVEAMAAGCVPVVPRCGGPWFDILDREEGKYGYSYGSLKEAAEKIEILMRDEGLRRSISVRAVERAEKFDASIFQKKIVDIIERFVRYKH